MVYPGNPEVEIEEQATLTSVVSKITLGAHTGTHYDAPRHAFPDAGEGMGVYELATFYGPARVIDCTKAAGKVEVSDLEDKTIQSGERVLLKTQNSIRGFADGWRDDYVWLSGEAAAFLAECGVQLVGLDWISVKERGSTDNRPHTEFLSRGIAILEGIDLSAVEEGEYLFSAFPVRWDTLDGAPARAVLIQSADDNK